MMRGIKMGALMAGVVLAACGPSSDSSANETAEDGMPGMPRTGGMEGMEQDEADMMARVAAHLQMIRGMSGDSVARMLPTHRQMVANMIAEMNREMREMDMPGGEAWDATVDSLRNDLIAMPEMDPAELESLMPAHHRRVTRVMEMHREMLAGMGM